MASRVTQHAQPVGAAQRSIQGMHHTGSDSGHSNGGVFATDAGRAQYSNGSVAHRVCSAFNLYLHVGIEYMRILSCAIVCLLLACPCAWSLLARVRGPYLPVCAHCMYCRGTFSVGQQQLSSQGQPTDTMHLLVQDNSQSHEQAGFMTSSQPGGQRLRVLGTSICQIGKPPVLSAECSKHRVAP